MFSKKERKIRAVYARQFLLNYRKEKKYISIFVSELIYFRQVVKEAEPAVWVDEAPNEEVAAKEKQMKIKIFC